MQNGNGNGRAATPLRCWNSASYSLNGFAASSLDGPSQGPFTIEGCDINPVSQVRQATGTPKGNAPSWSTIDRNRSNRAD
jgi:hypothetical protein